MVSLNYTNTTKQFDFDLRKFLPSILAAFKIVKGLMPEKAVAILKMINKKSISTYIDKNNCLVSWGGNDNYEFTFEPEKKQTTPTPPSIAETNGAVDAQDQRNQNGNGNGIGNANGHFIENSNSSDDKKVCYDVAYEAKKETIRCTNKFLSPKLVTSYCIPTYVYIYIYYT